MRLEFADRWLDMELREDKNCIKTLSWASGEKTYLKTWKAVVGQTWKFSSLNHVLNVWIKRSVKHENWNCE